MLKSRVFNSKLYRLLAAMLMLSLLCVQSAQQHIHLYDHYGHSHHAAAHDNSAHHVLDLTSGAHNDQLAEVELAQEALIKHLSSATPIVALFSALLLFCLLRLARRERWRITPPPLVQRILCPPPPPRGPPSLAL